MHPDVDRKKGGVADCSDMVKGSFFIACPGQQATTTRQGCQMPKHRKDKPTVAPGKEKTLGSALDEVSFRPLGHRIKVRQGISHARLRITGKVENVQVFGKGEIDGQ